MSILKHAEEIRENFKRIVKENSLDGILLADMEGLPLVSYLDEGMDEDTISASGAAIISAGLITASDAKKEGLNQVIIDTESGYILFLPVSNEYILGILTPKGSKLGIVRVLVKEVEELLRKVGR